MGWKTSSWLGQLGALFTRASAPAPEPSKNARIEIDSLGQDLKIVIENVNSDGKYGTYFWVEKDGQVCNGKSHTLYHALLHNFHAQNIVCSLTNGSPHTNDKTYEGYGKNFIDDMQAVTRRPAGSPSLGRDVSLKDCIDDIIKDENTKREIVETTDFADTGQYRRHLRRQERDNQAEAARQKMDIAIRDWT